MGMDRLGIEPGPSRMLSGCDATTPTAPELMRPRVLKHLLATAFSAEALSRPARSACFRTPFVGARCGGQTSAAWNSAQAPAGHSFQRRSSVAARPSGLFSSFLLFCCRRTPLVSFLFLSAAGALLWFALAVGKRVRPGKALKTRKQASKRASKQASKPKAADRTKKTWAGPQRRGRRHWAAALKYSKQRLKTLYSDGHCCFRGNVGGKITQ